MAFTVFAFTACQQEDLLAENDKAKNEADTTTDGIQVVDGYLSFASDNLFQSYLASLKMNKVVPQSLHEPHNKVLKDLLLSTH